MSRTGSDCDEEGGDRLRVPSVSELFDEAVGTMGVYVASSFVPRWEKATLQTQRDAATSRTLTYLRDDDYAGFLRATAATLADDPYNPVAVLHLGVGVEALGFPDAALTLYRYADRIDSRAASRKAVEGARSRLVERETLRHAYGVDVTGTIPAVVVPWVEVASRAVDSPVLGTPATVKGGKNKRVPVLDSPDGSPVSQVPGGTGVRVIEEQQGMARIQLPDGVVGWVGSKSLRS